METFNSADILKNQNRKKKLAALEVGLFEISFVLIIIIVLFGFLNYFNILSLSTLYPNQLGFLPYKGKIPASTNTQLINSPSPTPTLVNDVYAVSDVPGYTLTILNKNLLMEFLNGSRIWGKTFNQPTKSIPLSRINFHLANAEGDIKMIESAQGKILSSSTFAFQDSVLNLSVYLSPLALASANNSDIFQQTIITNIRDLSEVNVATNSKVLENSSLPSSSQENAQMFRVSKQ